MRRVLCATALGLCMGVAAAYGGTSIQALAHHWGKHFGDAKAVIVSVETVRLPAPRGHDRWEMIRMKGHRGFRVGCPRSRPGPMGECGAQYLELGLNLATHQVGLYWGLTASEVRAIARARHANAWLRIFPDTPALNVRCALPRGGIYRGRHRTLSGTCATVAEPSDHVRRVEFDETFRIHPGSKLSEAGWIVIFSRNGHVQSIRAKGQPPQLWK